MNFAERLQLLQSAQADPALLALLTVDLAYPDESAIEREALKQALLAAAIPHWCDPPFLASLLAVAPGEAERLHERLCALTVVEPFPARGKRAVNVHEATRLALREHLRQTMPHHWRTLSIRARSHLEPATSVHSRIECLHHLFAIDQEAAAAECEALERELLQNPEWHQALALSLTEVAAVKGWLQGSALVQARLIPLHVRLSRGESTTLEREARALVELAESSDQASGLAKVHCLFADVCVSQGQLEVALASYMETLAICGRLAEADPANAGWQRELAVAHSRVGDVYVKQGRLEAALTSFQKYLTISEQLAEADPANAGRQHGLAVAHSKVGDVYVKQGRLEAALTSFQRTLTISEQLAEADPANAGWQREFAVAHSKVGDVYVKQGRLEAALTSFQKYLTISEQLAEADPANAGRQRGLAVAHSKVGDVYVKQGRLEAALTSFQKDLTISEQLAEADPANAGWQRDLAVAHSKVGDVYDKQGDLVAALRTFQRTLTISQRLAEADLANADWQHDYAVLQFKIGTIFQQQKRLEAAHQAYKSSLLVLKHLIRIDPSNTGIRRELKFIKTKLDGVSKRKGGNQKTKSLGFGHGQPRNDKLT